MPLATASTSELAWSSWECTCCKSAVPTSPLPASASATIGIGVKIFMCVSLFVVRPRKSPTVARLSDTTTIPPLVWIPTPSVMLVLLEHVTDIFLGALPRNQIQLVIVAVNEERGPTGLRCSQIIPAAL